MTGVGVELARESAGIRDIPTDRSDSRIFADALALLKEGQAWFSKLRSCLSSVLPEVEVLSAELPPSARSTGSGNENLAMGNPSRATTNSANGDNYLIVRDQYALSYNRDHKTPNWVSWHLDADWLGQSGRSGSFHPDESLPAGFERALPADYTNSGYDRGHNCPSADRTGSEKDNEATFLMSNITPQAPDNNRGPWEKLESYCRELALNGRELYIISGAEGHKARIGNGINVPESFWKVVVILPERGMGPSDVTDKTDVIAVQMPNENGMRSDDWRKYLTTVSAIERHTGYDLLSELPDNIEKSLAEKRYGK